SRAYIEQKIASDPLCAGRHGNEYFVAGMLHLARELTGRRCAPIRVRLAHPPPRDTAPLATSFGTTRLDFGTGANGIVFDAATLALPIVSHDPPLLALLGDHAARSLSAATPLDVPMTAELRAKIRDALGREEPSLDLVASRLGMTPRTLQRRLAEEGSSFAEVLDRVREELARLHLADAKKTLGDVACRLGFADQRAFFRAFKRWTGTTPTAFRRSALGA